MYQVNTGGDQLADVKVGQVICVKLQAEAASLSQNSLIHQWYKDWASYTCESIREVSRRCKLCFGVPILRGDDPEYCELYDKAIKGRFSYREKLELMDYWPVTRLMSKKQKTLYLETMKNEAALISVYLDCIGDIKDYR
jgi:hypothetical protein